MSFTKHVGKYSDNRKVVIVFRQIPNNEENCLVVFSQELTPEVHDELMKIVEGAGQNDMELANVLSRTPWSNGSMALQVLHENGILKPVPVKDVTVTPNVNSSISLVELNQQLGKMTAKTTTADVGTPPSAKGGALDDKQIASQMRRQALQFENEAKKLRAEADALDPSRPGRPRKEGGPTSDVEAVQAA